MKFKFIIPVFVFVAGCSSVTTNREHKNYTLERIEGLSPGKTKATRIISHYGKPHSIHKSIDGNEEWLYFNDEYRSLSKVSFSVNKSDGIVTSVGFGFGEGEYTLKEIMGRFPNAKFKYREPQWINPHAAPGEVFYEDRKKGIQIVYQPVPDRVFSIVFFVPGTAAKLLTEKELKSLREKFDFGN